MKTPFLKIISALCGIMLLLSLTPVSAGDVAVGTVTIDEEVLRKAVIQVIRDDPKMVYDAYMSYKRELAQKREKQQLEYSFKHPATVPVRKDNPVIGPKDAAITIVCFTEFQCPYCARSVSTMDELMEIYPDQLRLVYKNTPLPNHTKALGAAKAALAAHRQGKFREFRDMLFADMSKLNDAGYLQLAGALDLDLRKFNADRDSETVAAIIETDQEEAKQLKIRSVPFFYVNGIPVKGAKSIDYFSTVIERLLAPQPGDAARRQP